MQWHFFNNLFTRLPLIFRCCSAYVICNCFAQLQWWWVLWTSEGLQLHPTWSLDVEPRKPFPLPRCRWIVPRCSPADTKSQAQSSTNSICGQDELPEWWRNRPLGGKKKVGGEIRFLISCILFAVCPKKELCHLHN